MKTPASKVGRSFKNHEKMKRISFVLLTFLFAASALGDSILWSKSIPAETPALAWKVGSDGSVAYLTYVNGSGGTVWGPIGWYDRSGTKLGDITTTHTSQSGAYVVYVSEKELILRTKDLYIELFQLGQNDQLEHKVINSYEPNSSGTPYRAGISYPYLLQYSGPSSSQPSTFVLHDLTNENYLHIVGDVAIGVHGKNLKVRWKTVVGAKYKVQSSNDAVNWTDYTGILDGNGSTTVINIPIDENSDQLFARVIKL